jgi:hypothetical protein
VGKGPSPLVGFNNNVKHRGRVFHVQTEDSGVSRPHIVTHLFADGGRILKSTRTDYSEHLDRADMGHVVRSLMKEQHKAMFIALRDGQLDETINGLLGPVASTPGEPLPPPPRQALPTRPRVTATNTQIPDLAAGMPSFPPSAKDVSAASLLPKPSPTLTELVLADLEGARSSSDGGAPSLSPKAPPKPAPKGNTPALGTPSVPAPRNAPSVPAPRVTPSRYAAARPSTIFTTNPEPRSIFGGASISEQSLDEVILSYLAEDLEGTPEK